MRNLLIIITHFKVPTFINRLITAVKNIVLDLSINNSWLILILNSYEK